MNGRNCFYLCVEFFLLSRAVRLRALYDGATGDFIMNVNDVSSVSSKKQGVDTRCNWLTFMFVSKCRKNVFRKQSSINACKTGFEELKKFGFEFAAFGFAGTHVHLGVNVPEKYSVTTAKGMLKSWSAKKIFAEKPNFRKLYPRGSFWSGYEHHQSFGADTAKAIAYVENQAQHHNIQVVQDVPAI
ncbi:MAG: transposase [archaeon]|nr:transposase [archaeon]